MADARKVRVSTWRSTLVAAETRIIFIRYDGGTFMSHPMQLVCTIACLLGMTSLAYAAPPPNNLKYGGTSGYAIPRYRPQRPTVSPYVALTGRFGMGGAATYYTFVQPQLQQRVTNSTQGQAINQLERQQQHLQAELSTEERSKVRSTGRQAGYMTQDSYFDTLRAK
jgi:hypothetical protein